MFNESGEQDYLEEMELAYSCLVAGWHSWSIDQKKYSCRQFGFDYEQTKRELDSPVVEYNTTPFN